MVALSIDTAANFCAVAVSDLNTGNLLSSQSIDVGRGHAELLMDMIDQSMAEANVHYSDIERVISTIGPGSFTGVRVGLSAARALGLALAKPVIGVSCLQACAYHALKTNNWLGKNIAVFAILDARRDEVYFQQFKDIEPMTRPQVSNFTNLEYASDDNQQRQTVLCGSAAADYLDWASENQVGRDYQLGHLYTSAPIAAIAELGMDMDPAIALPEPLYLRGPDAKLQRGFAVSRSGSTSPGQSK